MYFYTEVEILDAIFSPDHVRAIRNAIDEIVCIRVSIRDTLAGDPMLVTKAFKIDPIHYAVQFPKMIPIDDATQNEALNSFDLQLTDVDGERTPRRTFGVIQVSYDGYDKVCALALEHNQRIKELKSWLSSKFETSYARSRHIHAAYPNIIIATLYRTIKVAPESVYNIAYDWNNNQRVPKRIELDEIQSIIDSYGDQNIDEQREVIGQDVSGVTAAQIGRAPKGYEFVQLKNSKVHPQQIYYHTTPVEGKKTYRGREGVYRETLKANNCLIVPHGPGHSIKHQKLTDYVHKDKTDLSAHYKPLREGLGIYLRKKVKRKAK